MILFDEFHSGATRDDLLVFAHTAIAKHIQPKTEALCVGIETALMGHGPFKRIIVCMDQLTLHELQWLAQSAALKLAPQ